MKKNTESHVGLHVECQLLTVFDDNGNVSPNIIESPEHKT